MAKTKWLTTTQAGDRLGLSRMTVWEMCQRGELKGAYKPPSPKAHWRIPLKAVEAWLKKAVKRSLPPSQR